MGLIESIRRYLAGDDDGEMWRSIDQVTAACGYLISPTVAANLVRNGGHTRGNSSHHTSVERLVAAGQRHGVTSALSYLYRRQYVERDEDGQYRLRPGVLVSSQEVLREAGLRRWRSRPSAEAERRHHDGHRAVDDDDAPPRRRRRRVTEADRQDILASLARGERGVDIAQRLGLSEDTISRIRVGRHHDTHRAVDVAGGCGAADTPGADAGQEVT